MDRISELELQVIALGSIVQLLLGTHPDKQRITDVIESVRDNTKAKFDAQEEKAAIEAVFEPFVTAGRGPRTPPAA
ncbi:hypothetical protein PAQ31011_00816 [Pandoraea aquatica]|uniref:Uncharacterized protein n=1 Tax=Pandoraea aquatica TaxID=2508290 RepID=A0A5E4SG84_9BURK|nr:hypothetical protein PAQ31011_00816 [Pandoraea aquatica]